MENGLQDGKKMEDRIENRPDPDLDTAKDGLEMQAWGGVQFGFSA